jgi:tRNA (guanine37-N1)-methyltransferase
MMSATPTPTEPTPLPAIVVDVLTLFPGLFDGFLSESILKRAIEHGLIEVRLWNLRDWAEGKHKQVDDRPFGGGPGMVLMAPPVVDAVEAVRARGEIPGRLIALTPQGRRLDQDLVRELAAERRIVLLCGRYEGFDERILETLEPEQISIGDYVLSGGEVAAMVVIDAVFRLIPGALGDAESATDESFGPGGGLEYPHYTRPREFRGRAVPDILLSGNHAAIERWRIEQSKLRTALRRIDLIRSEDSPN